MFKFKTFEWKLMDKTDKEKKGGRKKGIRKRRTPHPGPLYGLTSGIFF